jgi:hypothetical protein
MLRTVQVHQGIRGSTDNTTNISTRCSNALLKNSIRYTYSFYTARFPSVFLHMQQIKILGNCFIQQLIYSYSLVMDQ